jgi:hypothetical protein
VVVCLAPLYVAQKPIAACHRKQLKLRDQGIRVVQFLCFSASLPTTRYIWAVRETGAQGEVKLRVGPLLHRGCGSGSRTSR